MIYTAKSKPINEPDVAEVASQLSPALNRFQANGLDGLDVALGTISALRMFVLRNVGVEGIQSELDKLATILRGNE